MEYVHLETDHVAGLASRSGDPSPVTARGVFRAIQAAAMRRWGANDLSGRTIALQGCGHVGYNVAKELKNAGAKLFATDVNAERLSLLVDEFGATAVRPEDIYAVDADIFSPCGLGGIINNQTISQLKVEIVAGAANNQLLEEKHGEDLRDRNILYAPDYVANSGGVINGCIELLGWDRGEALAKVEQIYDTVLKVFRIADEEGITPALAADRLAELRLMEGNR
jgi:leucine dehydrogenase